MCKISVIVISYNEKDYLTRAIESILEQSCNGIQIEIIIGDDGSNDGSIDLIEQIEKRYSDEQIFISHFVMERPEFDRPIIPSFRVSALIKRALTLVSGDYCVVLSADDHFCGNTKFKNAISFLDNNADYFSYVSGFSIVGTEKKEYVPAVYSSWLFWGHLDYFHVSCFVFRTITPEQLLDRFCDDTGLVYTILKLGKCRGDKEITFEYMQRESSIVHSSKECELLIIEAMIFQDILNDRNPRFGYVFATNSRDYRFIKQLKQISKDVNDEKFSHYLEDSSKYSNDLIELLVNSRGLVDKTKCFLFMIKMSFCHYYISVLWRICKLIGVRNG